jgi:hypothetical protein
MLVASDGIWEFIENEQAMQIVMMNKTPTQACAALIDESSRLWRENEGNYRDDITTIICNFPLFPGIGPPEAAAPGGTTSTVAADAPVDSNSNPVSFKIKPEQQPPTEPNGTVNAENAEAVGQGTPGGSFADRRLSVAGADALIEGSGDESQALAALRLAHENDDKFEDEKADGS